MMMEKLIMITMVKLILSIKKDESVEVGTFPLGNYQLDAKTSW